MNRLKVVLTALAISVMVLAIMPTMAVFAADPPDSTPSIITKKCYHNILEPGDFLIVWESLIPYATTPPGEPVTEVFIWEFIDTDGETVLGSWKGWAYIDDGYNYQCGSMYFGFGADTPDWDPTPTNTLRLRGNPLAFVTPPVYDYPINSVDYSTEVIPSEVQNELAIDILLISADLDAQWGLTTSLINDDETGQTLSIFGQAYFRGAIYGLQALAPNLFPLAVAPIDLADRAWTDAYITILENQYAGTWVETAKEGGTVLFGTDFDLVSTIPLLGCVVGLFLGNTMITNNTWNAAIDVALVLVVTAKLGFYGLGFLGLIEALRRIYFGMRLFRFLH